MVSSRFAFSMIPLHLSSFVAWLSEILCMIPANPSTPAGAGRPDIHVWMNIGEAAESMGVPVAEINEKADLGELESRISRDGIAQVLVLLPRRRIVPNAAALAVRTRPRQWTDSLESPAPRRRTWRGRATMAMLLAALAIGGYGIMRSRHQINDMAAELNQMSQATGRLSAERARLTTELAEYRQAAARAQGQLAVEWKIEDTLFKATANRHRPAPPQIASTDEKPAD